MDGIAKAKQNGVRFVAQKKLTTEQIKELQRRREEGVLIKTLMNDYKRQRRVSIVIWKSRF